MPQNSCEMRAVIRTATRDDLPSLRTLFARANDGPYALDAVAGEKCFGEGIAGAPVARIYGDFEGAAVTCGKWLRVLVVDRNARRRGIGSALLADSNASVIFAEPGNYFTPGVFAGDEGTRAFFAKRGFIEKAWTWNLDCEAAAAPQKTSSTSSNSISEKSGASSVRARSASSPPKRTASSPASPPTKRTTAASACSVQPAS